MAVKDGKDYAFLQGCLVQVMVWQNTPTYEKLDVFVRSFTVLEEHVGKENRLLVSGEKKAASFADSVGVGYYHIDLHPSCGGDNYIDFDSLPYQIPLGALIPRRINNLLPVCKNIGTTHITNGCYRLHPTEWGIGEAVGQLVAYALQKKTIPRAVRNTPELLADFQRMIQQQGVEIAWKA